MPKGAIIEIVQRAPAEDDGPGSVIMPTDIRIEGHSLYAPAGQPIKVHSVTLGEDPVSVTLTLFARRVLIGVDGDEGLLPTPAGGAESLSDQVDRLANWFRDNAPERILQGGAVDVAIATLNVWLAERTAAAA